MHFKNGSTFASAKQRNKVLFQGWSGSSVWLECLPVTQEVASSSLVRTAEAQVSKTCAFFVYEHKSNESAAVAVPFVCRFGLDGAF